MTARQMWSMGRDNAAMTLITPEAVAARRVRARGERRGRGTSSRRPASCSRPASTPTSSRAARCASTPGGRRLAFNRVVTLPLIAGPQLAGVPTDAHGFVPVDGFGRVQGLEGVYCAGDAADFPVKQGGLATQQADAIAEHVAALAGAPVAPQQFRPVLRGRLMTGTADRFLRHAVAGGDGGGEVSEDELWWPPAKVSGRYIAPWLAMRGLARPGRGAGRRDRHRAAAHRGRDAGAPARAGPAGRRRTRGRPRAS